MKSNNQHDLNIVIPVVVTHHCSLCNKPTDTYTTCECCHRQIPLCESCFSFCYPSKRTLKNPGFWAILHPIISEVRI